jgi:L,D-peptidoglycan transpeptidase YkuD (ErfK/YbiS/YcfS/YnhG family)
VTAASYSATTATLVAYDGTTKVLGPWTVHLGRAGLAKPGTKHEGDLHTPSGTFGIGYMFGWKPNPGVKFRYRVAHGYDTWSDDSASPYYNLWVDSRYHDPGAAPEHMKSKYYAYGIVIAYNASRTPHRGSAVFLHVDHASPTTGCVTLPTDRLVKVMRWLDPARSPQIKIGVT